MAQKQIKKHNRPDVITKLKSGEYKLVKYIPKPGHKQHEVWNTFRRITVVQKTDEPTVYIPGWIACAFCKWKLYAWNEGQGGFSSPMKHAKQHAKPSNQPSMHNALYKPITNEQNKIITRSCGDFILLHLRSFSAVEGEGFLRLCQSLINVGVSRKSKVSLADVKKAVPVDTTISRSICKREKSLREDLRNRVQGLYKRSITAFALTFDGWTDEIRSRQWLGVTLHFWSNDYRKIRCLYLSCREWKKIIVSAKLAESAIIENSESERCSFDQSIDVGNCNCSFNSCSISCWF